MTVASRKQAERQRRKVIEDAAKAAYSVSRFAPRDDMGSTVPWGSLPDFQRDDLMNQAMAVLMSIRDPAWFQIDAGCAEFSDDHGKEFVSVAYSTMIGTLVAEPDQ